MIHKFSFIYSVKNLSLKNNSKRNSSEGLNPNMIKSGLSPLEDHTKNHWEYKLIKLDCVDNHGSTSLTLLADSPEAYFGLQTHPLSTKI